MNRPEDLVFQADLMGLPKESLSMVARQLDLDSEGLVPELADRIWDRCKSKKDAEPLSWVLDRVFAGRTGVAWYKPGNPQRVGEALQKFRKKYTYFYDRVTPVNLQDIASDKAYVLGAAQANLGDGEIDIIRLLTKVRDAMVTDGISASRRPVTTLATIILNSAKGYIELRANSFAFHRLVRDVAELMGMLETDLKPELIAPFAERIEEVADKLEGTVVGITSKPDMYAKRMSQEQVGAVLDILDAVSEAIADPEATADLVEVIANARTRLASGTEDFTTVPLANLMLIGFQSIGLMADKEQDAREGLLYRMARPGVQHYGGYIRFPVTEKDGSDAQHTIRLGAITNSVAFTTKASEIAIRRVREVLFSLDAEARGAGIASAY